MSLLAHDIRQFYGLQLRLLDFDPWDDDKLIERFVDRLQHRRDIPGVNAIFEKHGLDGAKPEPRVGLCRFGRIAA